MVAFSTVDLSNFRLADETIEFSSFISTLNWSRRFFSLKFRDFLNKLRIQICIDSKQYHKSIGCLSRTSSRNGCIAIDTEKITYLFASSRSDSSSISKTIRWLSEWNHLLITIPHFGTKMAWKLLDTILITIFSGEMPSNSSWKWIFNGFSYFPFVWHHFQGFIV